MRITKILISCLFILTLVGCGNVSSSGTSAKSTLHSGQSVTLSNNTLVCSSKDNLSKMLSFMREKNEDGQNQMLLNGQATILSKGTKVNVISTGMTVEIETSDNKKWVVPMELVK